MALVSHFYHNTVIPMSEQQQSFFVLRSPAAVRRARWLQLFLLPNHADWKKLVVHSCAHTDSSYTVQTSAYRVVKHIPNVRKIRAPNGGLLF